jgi:hypothetical protein
VSASAPQAEPAASLWRNVRRVDFELKGNDSLQPTIRFEARICEKWEFLSWHPSKYAQNSYLAIPKLRYDGRFLNKKSILVIFLDDPLVGSLIAVMLFGNAVFLGLFCTLYSVGERRVIALIDRPNCLIRRK